MPIVQQIEGFETTAWCAVCGSPLRIHARDEVTGRRGELDPGFTANHVVVDGVSLCIPCLEKFPSKAVLMDMLGVAMWRYNFSKD